LPAGYSVNNPIFNFYMEKCMKKFVLVLAAVLLVGGGLFAQTGSDFSGPAPQFFSFDLGAGFGFALDTDAANGNGFGSAANPAGAIGGIANFGFKIEVLDNFSVGFDTLLSRVGNDGADPLINLFTGLRLAYSFIPQAGAAVGFGTTTSGDASTGAASLGFFGNFFQTRSASGITTGLRLRIDFVAPFEDFSAGKIVFAPAFNIGL
jgi:hypothetical protein